MSEYQVKGSWAKSLIQGKSLNEKNAPVAAAGMPLSLVAIEPLALLALFGWYGLSIHSTQTWQQAVPAAARRRCRRPALIAATGLPLRAAQWLAGRAVVIVVGERRGSWR